MFVNGIFRRHNSSRALITREKEMALWREKARTTADSDWPSDAPTYRNLRQRAQARGMRRSQGRAARRAARQICRWREKEGMIKFSERHNAFRRFAQREGSALYVTLALRVTPVYHKPKQHFCTPVLTAVDEQINRLIEKQQFLNNHIRTAIANKDKTH